VTGHPADPFRPPDLAISPEPTPEEIAAITVALLALAGADRDHAQPAARPVSQWREAALREGTAGMHGGAKSGWGHARGGWSG
jgi:hypothetical protein